MKLKKIKEIKKALLGLIVFSVLLVCALSQEEGEVDYGGEYGKLTTDSERMEYLERNFGIVVISGIETVEIIGEQVIVRGAELSLGSDTLPYLKITVEGETTVEVTGGGGYTGEILVKGECKIRSFEEVTVFPGKNELVELVKGKIKKGEVETLEPVKGVFADIPEKTAISMEEGEVNGNKITSTVVCIGTNCFSSKGKHDVEISETELKITGEEITHRQETKETKGGKEITVLKEKRTFNSPKGASLEMETGKWELSAGTEVTEIKAREASSVVKVGKETAYFPESDRSVCDWQKGSCVAIDGYNSMRVKAEEGNEIEINSLKLMPSLIVDKITDEKSKVEYTEHYLRNEKKQMIKLEFDEKSARAYPPASLKAMKTRVVFDYKDNEGKVKAFEFDSLGGKILIEGKTTGYFDEQIAENYYATSLGDVIKKEERVEYERFLRTALGGEDFNELSPEEKDFWMLLIHYKPENRDAKQIERLKMALDASIKPLPEKIDRSVLLRGLINNYGLTWESSLISLTENIKALSENNLVNTQLMDMYKEGKLSSEAVIGFHTETMFKGLGSLRVFDTPEEAKAYISLLGSLPRDSQEFRKLGVQTRLLDDLFKKHYTGRKDEDLAFLDGMRGLLEEKETAWWEGLELDLPPALKKEELPKFLEFTGNFENVKGILLDKEKNELQTAIDLWENAPSLVEVIERWDKDKTELSEYFILGGKAEPSKKMAEGIKIMGTLEDTLKNPKVSEETKEALKIYYKKNGEDFGRKINHLGDLKLGELRERLVEILLDEMKMEILAQPLEGLGSKGGLYRSSEELVFKGLAEDSGGENKLIDFLEARGYDLKHEKTGSILRMLAACGQLTKVIPAEEGKRKEVYDIVLKMADESFSMAGSTINSVLGNPKLRGEFGEAILKEYGAEKEETKRNFLQYAIRQNEEAFDPADAVIKEILENPSQRVREIEEKLEIPVEDFIKRSDKRGKVPVLKAAVLFTDTEPGSEMEASFKAFKGIGGEFKLVETTEGKGYALERRGNVGGKEVIFRMEAFNNPEEAREMIGDDPSYFMLANKGHSYSADIIWSSQEGYENNIPRIGYIGSCIGSKDVSWRELTKIYGNTAFFATSGTSSNNLNNKNILNIFKGLEKGYGDYKELTKFIKKEAGESDKARAWSGPETFFVDGLKSGKSD